MPRRLRFVPKPGTLVEVTCRTIHGRKLLTPHRRLNEMIVGTLARAKRRFGVRICAVAFLSNHAHLLLEVDDACQLAGFMGFISSKIAREVGRCTRWREKVWGRRYSAIVVSDEAEAQIGRLRYVLSQGVKEHLVARCVEWPGVHAAASLLSGDGVPGYWFDRTAEYRAKLQKKARRARDFADPELLCFDPLSCWVHLDAETRQKYVRALVEEIEHEASVERRRKGIRPLGARKIRRQRPESRPQKILRSPALSFHAGSRRLRRVLETAYRLFEASFREAAARLRSGDRQARFPEGSFPPRLPFVELAPGVATV